MALTGSFDRKSKEMKRPIAPLIAVLALAVATTATGAAANTTTAAKPAWRPTVTGQLSASSGFPTRCPPATPVGAALGLSVSRPVVVSYSAGLALECRYTSGTAKPTITWDSETRSTFLSTEKALGVKPITGLGKGVSAYSVASFELAVQKGALECTIEAYGANLGHVEALGKELLRSYW
jgi:hypothetical protein